MDRHYQKIEWKNYASGGTPLNETNLNKIDNAVYSIDGVVINHDSRLATAEGTITSQSTTISGHTTQIATNTASIATNTANIATNTSNITTLSTTKANDSDYRTAIVGVDYDEEKGYWTFTQKNGEKINFDQNIEKIPSKFSLSEDGILTMETDDGTKYTADIGSMIKQYTFNNTDTVGFTTTTDASGNKSIKADILGHSIGADQLETNYLANCQNAVTSAESKATDSDNYSKQSEAWASGTKGGNPVSSTDAQYHNNAKYYAEQAQQIVGSGIATTENVGLVKPDGTTITIDTDGTIHGAEQTEMSAENVSYDNEDSGLTADNVQDAINELSTKGGSTGVDVTQAEYDALPDSKLTDGVDYYITDSVGAGLIDDSKKATTTTWSSNKIDSSIPKTASAITCNNNQSVEYNLGALSESLTNLESDLSWKLLSSLNGLGTVNIPSTVKELYIYINLQSLNVIIDKFHLYSIIKDKPNLYYRIGCVNSSENIGGYFVQYRISEGVFELLNTEYSGGGNESYGTTKTKIYYR